LEVFDQIYDDYKADFIRSASRKFPAVPTEDLIDAWQDTVISFYEQVQSAKLRILSCSIRTFLFLLGYRYIIKYKRHYLKETSTDVQSEEFMAEVSMVEAQWNDPWEDEKEIMIKAVSELPPQSRKMLMLRYQDGKSIDEIKDEMQYSSTNAVSVTLSRNLKKLKEIIESKLALRIQ
jgi:RNA polymerase sigma-70 factor (ECF subfamily)